MESNKEYNSPVRATLTGIKNLFKAQDRIEPLEPSDRLDGKRVLITGSSSGLGLASAKELARLGGEVVMAVRSGIPEKGEEVKQASGSSKVFMENVDLSDFDSIDQLIDRIKKVYGHFDIVVCNAAVVVGKARKTKAGLDEMFMVNYLAKFYLIRNLLDKGLLRTGDESLPRIVFVDSESHRDPKEFEWDNFGRFESYTMGKTVQLYGYYKLLLATFAFELNRRLNPDETTHSVFVLCPGPVNSNIAREAPAVFKPLLRLVFKAFFRSPETACEPVVYFSASKKIEGRDFDYLFLMQRKEVDSKASNSENGKKLWKLSSELVASSHPVSGISSSGS